MRRILLSTILFFLLLVDPGVWAARQGKKYAKEVQQNFAKSLDSLRTATSAKPFCKVGFMATRDSYVHYVELKPRAAGLRVGDRILAIEGTPYSTVVELTEAIREHAPEKKITLTVSRAGSKKDIVVTCQDGHVQQRIQEKVYQAGAAGNWNGCITGTTELEQLVGPAAWVAYLRLNCSEAQRMSDNRRPTYQDAAVVYEARKRALAEAHTVPNGVQQGKSDVLLAISWLRDSGFSSFANDLQSLLDNPPHREAQQAGPEPTTTAVSRGTCFAVGPEGQVLTAYHIVKGSTSIKVEFPALGSVKATVERFSPANDLALLSVPLQTSTYLPLVAARSVSVGQEVFTLGFPAEEILGEEPKFTEGVVSSLTGPGGEASLMQITVPVQPGNSGGPLVTRKCEAAGVITATAAILPFLQHTGTLPQNVNWAISADYARPLLEPAAAVEPCDSRQDAIRRAQEAICRVTASQN